MCVETLETCLSRLRKKENISELRAQTDPRPETRNVTDPGERAIRVDEEGVRVRSTKRRRDKKKSEKTNAMFST